MVGVPGERALGFGALSLLLAGLELEGLAPRLQRVLRAAVGVDDGPADRLAVGVALHELLAALSTTSTLLLVVDDVQWVDPDTLQVLSFALRRLAGQRVLAVLAAREQADLPGGLPPAVALRPLDGTTARALLSARADDLRDDVAAVLVEHAQGNPLVLLEALDRLHPEQRRGSRPLDGPGALPQVVADAFRERVDPLPPVERDALLLAAVEERGDPGLLEQLAGTAAVTALRQHGLLGEDGGRLLLRHPLLQAAVIQLAAPAERRAAHARLASALQQVDPERALWHRALSLTGPDEQASDELTALAQRRVRRGAPVAAAEAFARAADLAPTPARAAALLTDAASAALHGARAPLSRALVDRAERVGPGTPAALAVRARLARLRGQHAEAAELLGVAAAQATEVARLDFLLQRWWAAYEVLQSDVLHDTLARLEDCLDAPPDVLAAARAVLAAAPGHPGLAGQARHDLQELLARPLPAQAPVDLIRLHASAANELGELSLSEQLELRCARSLRLAGDTLGSAEAVSRAAFLASVLGRWMAAEAGLVEVEQLVDEDFAPVVVADALCVRAELSAVQGRDEACRVQCTRLRALAERLGQPWYAVLADRREAVLELGAARWPAALALLERAGAALESTRSWHPFLSPAAELVEVLVRLDRLEEASAAGRVFLARTGPDVPPQVRARALRIEGLLAPPGRADAAYAESVRLDGQAGLLLLQARTQLVWGERLRRERHRGRAQEVLAAALTTFQRLGAAPWHARTAAELAACGGRVDGAARTARALAAQLTPQELQIAVAVSEGKRNREISAALFLSLRTVEFHLSSVYRKLEVSGRTQLVARMAGA